jgi:WhiB family redox-sensing transcriptional regulator
MTMLDAIMKPGEVFAGACAKSDPDVFNDPGRKNIEAAKRVCAGCPLRRACLEAAMRAEDGVIASARHGIYGGATGPERATLDKRRNPDRVPAKRNPSYRVAKGATV